MELRVQLVHAEGQARVVLVSAYAGERLLGSALGEAADAEAAEERALMRLMARLEGDWSASTGSGPGSSDGLSSAVPGGGGLSEGVPGARRWPAGGCCCPCRVCFCNQSPLWPHARCRCSSRCCRRNPEGAAGEPATARPSLGRSGGRRGDQAISASARAKPSWIP